MIGLALTLALGATPAELSNYDDLWNRRDAAGVSAELDKLSAEYAASSDPQKLWRASRWYLWISEDDDDKKRKTTNAKIGRAAGEKGLAIDPQCAPCGYWMALNVGVYGAGINVVSALFEGIEWKFRGPIETAAAADPKHENPDLDFVGPQKSLGRYWYELPWPKRSYAKSRAELETAVAAHPEDLHASFFLVETLEAMGEHKLARERLANLLSAPIVYDAPDARRVKARAAVLAAKLGVAPAKIVEPAPEPAQASVPSAPVTPVSFTQ